jgi:uncharacterized membrane protein
MSDLPLIQSPSAPTAGKIAALLAQLIALIQTATADHAHRRAARRAPEEILAAQARREDARRAVDRLLLLR